MRVLLAITCACIAVLGLLMGGIIGYARRHLNTQEVSLRAFLDPGICPEARSCWHGIEFLSTSSDKAYSLMAEDQSLHIRLVTDNLIWGSADSDALSGWNIAISEVGVEMDGRSNAKPLPLSELLATYGTPVWVSTCLANFRTGPMKFQMRFKNGFALEALSSAGPTIPELSLNMPVDFIGIGHIAFVEGMGSAGADWQGFKKWGLYPPVTPGNCF